jgi:hypothetical protein
MADNSRSAALGKSLINKLLTVDVDWFHPHQWPVLRLVKFPL